MKNAVTNFMKRNSDSIKILPLAVSNRVNFLALSNPGAAPLLAAVCSFPESSGKSLDI